MHVPSLQNYVSVNSVVTPPIQIRANLSSSNENISPVIDLQQLSAYAVSNRINSQTASDINVPEIDTRVLIKGTDLLTADISLTGTGTVTSSGTSVTGTSSTFTTQVVAGNVLCRTSDNAIIGTVLTVNSNTSITLTAGEAVIMNDLSFVPSDHSQAEDRSYRYGQKSNVSVYYPIFENTIEGVIYDILNHKKNIFETVMGDNVSKADIVQEIMSQIHNRR